MEALVIKSFLPDLVTAISDCVQPVSDQCLAKGLIPDSVYKRVLESGGTSEDKARNLILAVKTSTETDSRCLEILLNILEQVLPYGVKNAVLLSIKKELIESERSRCGSLVPVRQSSQVVPVSLTSTEIEKQQNSLIGKLEDAIRRHEHACAEKKVLEETMYVKAKENMRLKRKLESMNSRIVDEDVSLSKIEATEERISSCEAEMAKLKERINEVESIIEEQGMRVKRGRNAMGIGMVNLMGQLSMLAQREITDIKQESEKKEAELSAALKEKEKELLVAQKEGKEKEQCNLEALKEKDTELQLAQKAKQKAEDELHVKDLTHKIAIQEKDLKIKDLELKYERQIVRHSKQDHEHEQTRVPERKRGFLDWFQQTTKRQDNHLYHEDDMGN